MGERLFDLDLQLAADSILMIVAVLFILTIFIAIPILIINLVKTIRQKDNCKNCPYKSVSEKTV